MCPLCYGAFGALAAIILGPLGLLAARKDPIVVGAVVFLVPIAAMQAAGKYLSGLEVVKYLWLGRVFIPWWFYAIAGVLISIRLFHAWRVGRIEKMAKAAAAASE